MSTFTPEQLADRVQAIAANPATPGMHFAGLNHWIKDDCAKLLAASPEQLNNLLASLKRVGIWELGSAAANAKPAKPEAQPAPDRAPERDPASPEAISEQAEENFDTLFGSVEQQQAPASGAGMPAKPMTATNRLDWRIANPFNFEMARTFLAALGTHHTYQTFDDTKARKLPQLAKVISGDASDEIMHKLFKLNADGAGIFVTVNQTDGKGRKAGNITRTRAIYGDFDGEDAIALFEATAAKLPPSIVVASSPDKRHAYWLVDMSPEEGEAIQYKMPEAVGCDPAAKDITRVLRVPGFYHRKGDPVLTKLLECRPERTYEAWEIISAFGLDAIEGKAKTNTKAKKPSGTHAGTSAGTNYDLLYYAINDRDAALLHGALRHVREDGKRAFDPASRDVWVTVGMALARSGEVGFKLFHEWSAEAGEAGGYIGEDDCREHFAEFEQNTHSRYPDIFSKASIAGWQQRAAMQAIDEDFINPASFIAWGDLVPMVKISWFWKHRLAIGMLHLLGGTPGTGKSTIAFTWAAIISSGGTFPDGVRAPKGKVLIWSGEDSYEATIKPRLVAAGADMTNIGFLNQPRALKDGTKVDFNPAEHLPALMAEIEWMPKGEIAMLIIDPIVTMLGNGDNNSTSEVRAALAPLVTMLYKLGIIGLGIIHFTKGSENKDPKDRFSGSAGYIALARVGFAVVKDQNEDGRHLLTVAKSNIGPEGGGYNYHIEQTKVTDPVAGTIETSKVVWDGTLEGDARTLIREAEVVQRDRPAHKLQRAKGLLRDLLRNGPMLVHDIRAAAEDADIGWRTMEDAKNAVGAASERSDPDDKRSPYQWLIRIANFDYEVANAAT